MIKLSVFNYLLYKLFPSIIYVLSPTIPNNNNNIIISIVSFQPERQTSLLIYRIIMSEEPSIIIGYLCRPAYRVKWLKNKGAILIIVWSFLVSSVFHFVRAGYQRNLREEYVSLGGVVLVLTALLFPIGGWLADAYIGRYRMICYSTWMMWIGAIFIVAGEIFASVNGTYNTAIKEYVIYTMFAVMAMGFGGFQSNIIQLGVDQLIDASSTEITSFITWYVLILYASGITLQFTTECIVYMQPNDKLYYVKALVIAFFLTIVLCSDFLLHGWLVKEQIVINRFNLIPRVIKYALKNRKLEYMVIVNNNQAPSRLDVAKQTYGGPFTSQEVEDVKTFLQLLKLVALCTFICCGISLVEYAKQKIERHLQEWEGNYDLSGCYNRLTIRYSDYLIAIAVMVLYEFLIYPFFNHCLPKVSIERKFLLGAVLFLMRILALLSIEIVLFVDLDVFNAKNSTGTCIFTAQDEQKISINISGRWLIIPGVMSALSSLLFFQSGFEFIWAQAPTSMTGLLFGICYAFTSLNTIFQAALASPFLFIKHVPWQHIPLTCGIWYFTLHSLAVAIILAIVAVMIKKYKRRDRNDNQLTSTVSYS